MLTRGIVITPTHATQRSNSAVPPYIDPGLLRKCVLYWDMVDCPDDALGRLDVISDQKEYDLLASEGILQRTVGYLFKKVDTNHLLSFFAEHPYEFCVMAQSYALKKHYLSGLPERWSIGQVATSLHPPDSAVSRFVFLDREGVGPDKPDNVMAAPSDRLYLPDKDSETRAAIGIELFQSLPVPSQDVPLTRIVEFKRKRWDELLRFRHAMDRLYDTAVNSQDIPGAVEYAVDEIAVSLRDIDRAMNESFTKRILATVKIELSLNSLAASSLTGALIGSRFDLTWLGAVAGAVASTLRISLDSSLLRPKQIPPEFRDYAYIYHAGTEFRESKNC